MTEDIEMTSVVNSKNESVQLVTIEKWLESIDSLSNKGVGIIVKPRDDVGLLKDSLDKVAIIALDFNNFDDGRSYTHANLLSKRWKYSGEIIGVNAHIDQLQFMIRSGVTGYKLLDNYKNIDEIDYSNGFSICYQAAANNSGLKEKF